MRSTPNVLLGVAMTSLVLVQDHLLAVSLAVGKICKICLVTGWYYKPFQYIMDLIISLRHERLGCWM
jgi:hypothetical protein